MPGGNTDEVYKNGTGAKSQMIVDLHPDVSKIVWRFNRIHHYSDYSGFSQRLKRVESTTPTGINNYGMKLQPIEDLK